MTREEEIKQELIEIEERKKQENIELNLSRMNEVGKCFASHDLSRYMTNKPSYNFSVIHITGKEYREGCKSYMPYGYTGKTINCKKNGDEFHVNCGTFYDKDISLWKYEISLEQFQQVEKDFIPSIEVCIDKLRNAFKAQDYVSQGDHHDARCAHEHLDALKIEFINLADEKGKLYGSNITILEILRWQHHPFIYNTRLYKLPNWLDIIQSIRDTMHKEACSWGGSIYERDYPRIKMLDEFIIKYVINE